MALKHNHLKTGKVVLHSRFIPCPYNSGWDVEQEEYYHTIEYCEDFKKFKEVAIKDIKNWDKFEEDEIPSLYTVRSIQDNMLGSSFECGLDLRANKKIWLGLDRESYPNYKSIEKVLDDKFGKDKWYISTEEYFISEK